MLPPRAWKAFERISVDVSTTSSHLWEKRNCADMLPLSQLGFSPQAQGRVSEHWGDRPAAPLRLTSEVRFLRVSLGVSQPLQGLTWAGMRRGALAAEQDERGAPKLQLQTLPGGSRGKSRLDCTWHPCSVVLQSTESQTSCARWPNVTSFCTSVPSHALHPWVGRGTPRASPHPRPQWDPPTTRAGVQWRWQHQGILPA